MSSALRLSICDSPINRSCCVGCHYDYRRAFHDGPFVCDGDVGCCGGDRLHGSHYIVCVVSSRKTPLTRIYNIIIPLYIRDILLRWLRCSANTAYAGVSVRGYTNYNPA